VTESETRDYSHEVRKHDSLALRLVFAGLGAAFLALGAVGAFVPVLPTVPLWLVAAACFARSSTRVYNWLLNHRHFGHGIREWRHHRAIPWRAKRAALALMALSFGVTIVFLLDGWLARSLMGVAGVVLGAWLWRLPSRDAPGRESARER
jgi:uncharacterized membrane protein YbaN (DUF454 family)